MVTHSHLFVDDVRTQMPSIQTEFVRVCLSIILGRFESLSNHPPSATVRIEESRFKRFVAVHRSDRKGATLSGRSLAAFPRPRRRRSPHSSSAVNFVKPHLFGTCKFDNSYNGSLTFRSLITSIQSSYITVHRCIFIDLHSRTYPTRTHGLPSSTRSMVRVLSNPSILVHLPAIIASHMVATPVNFVTVLSNELQEMRWWRASLDTILLF